MGWWGPRRRGPSSAPHPRSYPAGTWSLAAKFRDVLHLDDSPRRLAIALALGVFIGCTPFWGLQTLLSIVVATALRLSRAATVTGTWLNLPWLAPIVYGVAIKIGQRVVPGLASADAASFDLLLHNPGALTWATVWSGLRGSSLQLLVGCALVGAGAAAITYAVAVTAIGRRRSRPHADIPTGRPRAA